MPEADPPLAEEGIKGCVTNHFFFQIHLSRLSKKHIAYLKKGN
jgi:hypothetical protein